MRQPHHDAELELPRAVPRPSPAGSRRRGRRRAGRARVRRRPSARRSRPATSGGAASASTGATSAGPSARHEPRVDSPPQRVRHASTLRRKPRAAYFAPTSVSARRECPLRRDPGERERPPAVRQPRDGAVGRRARPSARAVSSPCSSTSAREQRVRAEAPPEPGRADHLRCTVRPRPRPGSGRPARSSGSSHARPGGYDGVEQPGEDRARSAGPRRVVAGEPAPREQRPGHVERPPHRLAPAHRRHPRAGRERVQPLGRRRHPGADHGDVGGVLVRLVRVHGPRIVRELLGQRQARDARGASRTCRNVPPPSSSKPSVDRAARARPRRCDDRRRPSRVRARTLATCSRNSGTVGW